MAMRAHALPLPDLQGEPGAVDEGARRWREWAEHFGAAADRVTRIRDTLDGLHGEAVQAAVARLDDAAGRALRLAKVLSDASHTIGRYAGELHEHQHDARRASDDDERAHEDADRASALVALLAPPRTSGAGGKGHDPELRRVRQRQTEAEEDEAAAVARWDAALDERDATATAAAGNLDALSAGAATVDGRSGHTAGMPFGGSAGPVVLLAGTLSTNNNGGSGPAVAPEVADDALRDILDNIYSPHDKCIGDGKVGTALIHEIETGERTFGKWHAVDSADQLTRLIKLL